MLKANIALIQGKLAHKLVRLSRDVKRDISLRRQLGNLKGSYPRDDATVLRHGLSSNKYHVHLPQQAQDMRHRSAVNLGNRDAHVS